MTASSRTIKPCLANLLLFFNIQLAMKACPYRATFYPKLGQPQEEVMPKLEAWLKALYEIVEKEEGVFKAGSYGEI